jgi:hypothetical protein
VSHLLDRKWIARIGQSAVQPVIDQIKLRNSQGKVPSFIKTAVNTVRKASNSSKVQLSGALHQREVKKVKLTPRLSEPNQ